MTIEIFLISIMYILIIILLMVLIILGIRGIFAISNVNEMLDDVNKKLHSLDGVFNFIESAGYTLEKIDKRVLSKVDSALKLIDKIRGGDSDE